MKLTVELWHFIPVHPGSMRRILEPLRDYLERKEGAYTVSVVGNLKAKKTFENHFGINLDGLLKLAGLSDPVPQSKFYNYHWHVYATFPPTIEKYLRKIGWTNLDKFEFNKFNLTAPHAPMVERVARDIVESWLTHKKITRVHLQGHTDKIGKEPYNLELGKKRATAVRDAVMEAVKQIAPLRPYDLDPSKMRIQYVVESLGETKPISRNSAENRRVEVRFHFTTGPKIKPVQLEEVVIRATRLLKGRNSMDQEKVKKLLCVLSKMRLPNPDDRFIGGGQAVLNIKNSNKFPTPEEWNRVRLQLTFPNMFGSHIPDDQFLRGLESLEDMISGGLREMNRIKDYDGGIPTFGNMATPSAMMQLFVQVDQMARDKNSVYSCY